ncbi:Cytochrome c6 [Grimontia celer]|uniref:Cytochrome c6 n=1 Tax=Grimontia celer TaxID=1796497 RepID=A0A128EVW2_9GAMM|nr:cytochrome c [Grimontia celer]CZF78131.1 Cytochrome c6 [Grimontia celer]
MKKGFIFLFSALLLTAFGFIGLGIYERAHFSQPNLANGKALYERNCLVCHGDYGQGNGTAANALATKPENIYQALDTPLGYKSRLIAQVMYGDSDSMPAFRNGLTKEDVNDIFEYVIDINEEKRTQ